MEHSISKKLAVASTTGGFAPKKWWFWRTLIVCFVIVSFLGHWLEIAYCGIMDSAFGIVAEDYAAVNDPWYVPYRIYGYGALFMTFLLEPLKDRFLARRKTIAGAFAEMFIVAIFISMVLELTFGLIINQPDEFGNYPHWDNSELPLNILGQAWLVNDFFIGFIAMVYLWVIFPAIAKGFSLMPHRIRSIVFVVVLFVFAVALIASLPYL